MDTTGEIGMGVVCSAVGPWGAPLTVTRRFLDKGCTPGVAEEPRDKSFERGGDWGSSLSSSLIRTVIGDWWVASLVRNAFKQSRRTSHGDLRIDGCARWGWWWRWRVLAGAFPSLGGVGLDRRERVGDGRLAEGRVAERLCKGGKGLWDGHGEEERKKKKKRDKDGTEEIRCRW